MLTIVDPIENRIRLRRERLMATAGVLDLNDPIWTDNPTRRGDIVEDHEVEDFLA